MIELDTNGVSAATDITYGDHEYDFISGYASFLGLKSDSFCFVAVANTEDGLQAALELTVYHG